jgi:micrococcal nuclease
MNRQPMPSQLWVFRAYSVRVIDGDTVDVRLDAGFRNFRDERLRLLGINAPEKKGATMTAARAAQAFAVSWLDAAQAADLIDEWPLIVETHESDVFGRFLAVVWRTFDGACLNTDLLDAGHAVVDIRALPPKP